mmetsp:Transcript_6508/g.19327  ORF Transcript_6508/g.19327 Transcript_6508/m.19327 type:complete len:183 (-) Transcript_6508:240-788(-)
MASAYAWVATFVLAFSWGCSIENAEAHTLALRKSDESTREIKEHIDELRTHLDAKLASLEEGLQNQFNAKFTSAKDSTTEKFVDDGEEVGPQQESTFVIAKEAQDSTTKKLVDDGEEAGLQQESNFAVAPDLLARLDDLIQRFEVKVGVESAVWTIDGQSEDHFLYLIERLETAVEALHAHA